LEEESANIEREEIFNEMILTKSEETWDYISNLVEEILLII